MANRVKFQNVKEETLDSICKISDREQKPYLFLDPDNVTGFKCAIGKIGDVPSYLFEFIQTMWGNDEIYEYILKDDLKIDLSQFGPIKEAKLPKLDLTIQYTEKKGLFSRYLYNVYFEYKNERYYLFVKTIAPRLIKILNNLREN